MQIKQLLINSVVMRSVIPVGFRSTILRRLGMNLGARTYLGSGTGLKGTMITTGQGCFINHDCHVDGGELTLGSNVFVGPRVTFITLDHQIGQRERRASSNVEKPIRVGNGVWIGANVTVLGGVTIAEGCIIAAGAVVTGDTIPDSVYGGVPARRLKALS